MAIHGVINLRKPPGQTSMNMARLVKRLTGERKVGHGGTLDPLASGVLPIFLGQATPMMNYLIEGVKVYRSEMLLGVSTDTLDAMGAVTHQADPSGVTRDQVEEALKEFRGTILQVPPMYSALKQDGKRLYALARAGVEVDRKPRQVEITRLELLGWNPPRATIEVECGRGVYIRSLVRDLGDVLGCGAHLTSLVRKSTGPFLLEEAIGPEELTEAVQSGSWRELIYSPDFVVGHLKAAVVSPYMESHIKHGRQVALGLRGRATALHEELCRIYTADGRFLAMARFDRPTGLWQPVRVFDLSDDAGHQAQRKPIAATPEPS